MRAFVPTLVPTPRDGLISRGSARAVQKRRRNSVWINSLDSNGVDFPPKRTVINADSEASVSVDNSELEFDQEFPDPCDVLRGATLVSIKLPLDMYLEESASGKVYVDELVPGGNAEKIGQISEGDIILAVSLPFGDGLFPVPKHNGLQMVKDFVGSRDDCEEFFNVARVSSGGVEALRQELTEKAQQEVVAQKKMKENAARVHTSDYPVVKLEEPEEQDYEVQLKSLREEGFDV